METEKYYIKISPGVVKGDLIPENYSGNTFNVYDSMSEILSGGTNGDSLLTGLTIPITFNQSFNDLGYYTPFDGYVLQKEVTNNFLFTSGNSVFDVQVYNTSETELKKFLQLNNYVVSWGDGSPNQNITTTSPNFLSHTYAVSGQYKITLTQSNPWGVTEVTKTVHIPMTGATISNPQGEITFTPQGGSWAGTPLSYDYIFSGDAANTVADQVTSNYVSVPYLVSGYTKSQITDLKQYGSIQYATNVPIIKNGQVFGVINVMDSTKTGYTINDVTYYDYSDGTTIFIANSSGLTSNDIVASAITKQEVLIDMVSSPEIQSEVFIERGKNSAFEGLERLGEVDNIGDLTSYGYGFFKINKV